MKNTQCRGCNSANLVTLHDFGLQPLAGSYPAVPNNLHEEPKYPLDLSKCQNCGLIQVTNLPPIELIFHDDYRYSTSTIPTLVQHFKEYANWLNLQLSPKSNILEFGCNDGTLLQFLQQKGFVCKGVDASDNVANLAREKGLDVVTGFLSTELVVSQALVNKFQLVTCSNVFAHIDNLMVTLSAVRLLLVKDGLFAIEVHDGELLDREGQFDTIYHEHLTYFTEPSLRQLLERNGFVVISCEKTSMHGGGLRVIARKTETMVCQLDIVLETIDTRDFVAPSLMRCIEDLGNLYKAHGPLVGYGAAGRAQMFINMTKSSSIFSCIFDDSPLRQKRYVAGTNIPILPYLNPTGKCLVILAWNYAPYIKEKVKADYQEIWTLLPTLQKH